MIAVASPLIPLEEISRSRAARGASVAFGGCNQTDKWTDIYVQLEYVFPNVVVIAESELKELTDHEVLELAESGTSFAFLDSPEEDVYNDLLGSKE